MFSHQAAGSGARARWRIGAAVLGVSLLLGACTSAAGDAGRKSSSAPAPAGSSSQSQSSAAPSSTAAALPVSITAAPAAATNLDPTTPITVSAANGTLASVALVNPAGKAVTGTYNADRTSWTTSEVLGYSKSYRLTARATSPGGEGFASLKRTLTTLTPDNMTMPYLNTIYGSAIQNGATYGVGMIPVVNFDEPITDKKAAEQALQVTTTPHVDGAWTWLDDHTAHWRPQQFYQPGTKVTIDAKVYGVRVGPGLYGQADQSVSYKIGPKHVSIANAATHQVKVYFNGKLQRTMPTSMGRGGTVTGSGGRTIYLWTMPGTYTVIGHENPAIMSSDSYGLPANSPAGYAPEAVPWATKISTDGIYLHELDATVWAQGSENLSHGCLNLNQTNAEWYYKNSLVGDIVQVVHSGGPALQLWQGGDWSVPWKAWLAGSALR